MNYLSVFVDILNEYMEREDITINQFSKRVGIVGNAISKWLSQEYFPTIDCVIKIADYMNCSIDYLFGFSESSAIQLSENSANFYDRFVLLLEKKHLTAYQVAKSCKIGESAISKWKKGVYPKTETIIILAQFFDCSIDYLIGREK